MSINFESEQFNQDHHLQWNTEKVSEFWNFIQKSEAHSNNYFTKYYCREITQFLKYLVLLEGKILDYGCGAGYLCEFLLLSRISCEGCDFSEKSVHSVNQKLNNNFLWKGAKLIDSSQLPYEDDSVDLILCIETIEHILDGFLESTLKEFYRILKPRTGRLFITTPNDENLEINSVFCPDCHAIFHQYQHLRKFTKSSLSQLMQEHEFVTEICDVTDFDLLTDSPYVKSIFEYKLNRWSGVSKWLWSIGNIRAIILDFIYSPSKTIESNKFKRMIGFGRHLFWLGSK